MSSITFLRNLNIFRTGLPRICGIRKFCSEDCSEEKVNLTFFILLLLKINDNVNNDKYNI